MFMRASRSAIALLALALALAGSAVQAQTCGGTLSCTTTPAYTYSDSGAGNVLIGKSTYSGSSPAVGGQGTEQNVATGSAGVEGFDAGSCSPLSLSLGPAGVIGGSVAHTGGIGYTHSQSNGQAGGAGDYWDSLGSCCGS